MPMFCTPVSGSLVMYCESVVNGAMSQPGVEMGTGRRSRPSTSISWHGAFSTTLGGIGRAIARVHVSLILSSGQPMPMRYISRLAASAPTATGMSYLRPLLSTTFLKRKALRSFSAMPPRNCHRTKGCISVSLLIARSTVMSRPAFSSAARCSCRSEYFRSAISVHRDVFFPDDASPLRLLALHQLGKRLPRGADDVAVLRFQALAHAAVAQQLDERAVQPVEDGLRRRRGRAQRHPRLPVSSG